MESDQNGQNLIREGKQKIQKPIYFLPYDVQLQNTFCTEIIAKRNPEEIGMFSKLSPFCFL